MSRFACTDGLKLSPTIASASREQSEARSGSPFSSAPAPRTAVNVSCAAGSCTTATTVSEPSCSAMHTDQGPAPVT